MISKRLSQIDSIWDCVLTYCRERKFSKATAKASKLLRVHGDTNDQTAGLEMMAYILRRQKKKAEALEYILQASKRKPTNRGIQYTLMVNLIECARYQDAVKSAERLIIRDRRTKWKSFTDSAHFHKAYALYKLGRLEEAIQEFSLVEDEGNSWIDGRIVTKALLLSEIARARDLKR